MNEQSNIRELKGIGEKTAKLFAKLEIVTVSDLLQYYPKDYDVYKEPVPIGELSEGRTAAVCGSVAGRIQVSGAGKVQMTTLYLKDGSGELKVVWFRMPFLRNTLSGGGSMILRGRIAAHRGKLLMEHPEIFYPSSQYEGKLHSLQPVYPLTKGLTNKIVLKSVRQAVESLELFPDCIPKEIRLEYQLAEYNYAIRGIHFPEDTQVYAQARKRLVFEEFLTFVLSVRKLKEEKGRIENEFSIVHKEETDRLIDALPYTLTNAQCRVFKEIERDLEAPVSMSRLVQGDVGSGKTIIAFLALVKTALNGCQGALMAPTEVLARQHYEALTELLLASDLMLRVILLTGSMSTKEKRAAYDRIECGAAHIIIGTHALIQDRVYYRKLALVVTDEQHRFGVRQREVFAGKGEVPHVLVMSATPIPRTLAMILYGDLDISIMNELPANRLPIKNCVVDTGYRETAYRFMKAQVKEGRQCYIICPMVEESEFLDVENVTDYSEMLKGALGDDIVVEALSGRMSQVQKDAVMERFARNEIHVLVSTTVVEVGINVPNATVMMVENAERFGLSQLHQLRGRVGRGKHQSYCIFMSGSKTKETKERLAILNKSNDGFQIADEDLRLRGPGDLFGIRQSGLMDFKIGDIYQDANILQMANEAADRLEQPDCGWLKNLEKHARTSSVIL